MTWINKLLGRRSAHTAKDRLKIIIAQERSAQNQPDFLPLLQREILAVIEKYMSVSSNMVEVAFSQQDKSAILKLNVLLPPSKKPS